MPSNFLIPTSCAHCKLRSFCESKPFDYTLIELAEQPGMRPDWLSLVVFILLGLTPILMLWVFSWWVR